MIDQNNERKKRYWCILTKSIVRESEKREIFCASKYFWDDIFEKRSTQIFYRVLCQQARKTSFKNGEGLVVR
jgi:hypothetical protein